MRAFLFLNLEVTDHLERYLQPEMQLVKSAFPDVALLDLDAGSDALLLHYAKRMLHEADQSIICIKANENAALQTIMAILEDIPQVKGQLLFLLIGENQRFQRILAARSQLNFKQVNSDAALLEVLSAFYT